MTLPQPQRKPAAPPSTPNALATCLGAREGESKTAQRRGRAARMYAQTRTPAPLPTPPRASRTVHARTRLAAKKAAGTASALSWVCFIILY